MFITRVHKNMEKYTYTVLMEKTKIVEILVQHSEVLQKRKIFTTI